MAPPKITAKEEQNHVGKVFIALDGKVLAYGNDAIEAFELAKKVVPDLEEKEFLISRVRPKYLVA